jgi:uncharacterized protein YjiS (DUF1127 family)
MVECIDTIDPRPGPLEAAAARVSMVVVKAARWLDRAAVRSVDLMYDWRARAVEREVLRSLDDRILRDVGISRADVERELNKPFWQR